MEKNTGFTLMELMVAIAIIAITASIAIPNIIGWLPTHRLASASRAILSVLQQARLRAVKENTFVTVQFDHVFEFRSCVCRESRWELHLFWS